jgi:hypothetical protein
MHIKQFIKGKIHFEIAKPILLLRKHDYAMERLCPYAGL